MPKGRDLRKSVKAEKSRDYLVGSSTGNLEHREVWRRYHGKIPKGWIVHHIDGDKHNNHIDNLIALPSALHDYLHLLQRKHRIVYTKNQLDDVLKSIRGAMDEVNIKIALLSKQIEELTAQRNYLGRKELEAQIAQTPKKCEIRLLPPEVLKPVTYQPKVVLRRKNQLKC
jgi:hypothetical protein